MKKRYKRKNLKSALLLVIILLAVATALIFAVQQSVINYQASVDRTRYTLAGETPDVANYNIEFDINPLEYVQAIGCGENCSYDFTVGMSQSGSLLTPVSGLVQNEWFEGTVTRRPSLKMVWNYASDLERTTTPSIENAKLYCRISGSADIICRATGDIISQAGQGGHVYGDFSGAGYVTIPKQSYYDTWLADRQEQEVIEEEEIEAELQDPVIEEVVEPTVDEFIDTTADETAPTQQDVRNTNILLVVFLAVIVVLVIVYLIVWLGSKKK